MKQKILITTLIVLTFLFLGKDFAFAEEKTVSARIETKLAKTEYDYRADILRGYLNQYNSPLADNAEDFVKYADMYDLDWRFVAAISGVESTFGHQIPANSYNGWGWGVYGGNVTRFTSWEDGIETISKGLRENYMDKWGATNVYEIGSIYAASPTWAQRVEGFMYQIQVYSLKNPRNALSLTI